MSRWMKVLTVAAHCASIATAAVIASVATFVYSTVRGNASPNGAAARAANLRPSPIELVAGTMTSLPTLVIRPRQATVAIIEFSDFECPFCGKYARDTWPTLRDRLVDGGRVAYGFRDYPIAGLHPNAIRASLAARCANEQGKFWEMRASLFDNQRALNATDLERRGQLLGLRSTEYSRCLQRDASALTADDVSEGRRLGVRSTPTFLIGNLLEDGSVSVRRRVTGALPYQVFAELVDSIERETLGDKEARR